MIRPLPICALMSMQWSAASSNPVHTVRMRYIPALLTIAITGSLLAGCSTEETDTTLDQASSTSSPSAPAPTPTVDVEAIWAGSVCTAIDDLTASVADIADSLTFDPLADQDVITQFESQLADGVAGLEDETAALGAALGAAPVDYVAASSTITELEESLATVQAAGDVVQQHLQAATQASNPLAATVELGKAAVAAKAAWEAGTRLLDQLSDARADAESTLGPAFDRAPECAG